MANPEQTLADFDRSILIYGAGTMAGAMLRRWLACGLSPARVTAIRRSAVEPAPGVATYQDAAALDPPSILLIGIKPQMLSDHADTLARLAGPDTLALSILAGVPLADLARIMPHAGAIVRVMPNMPVAEGRGVVALTGEAAGANLLQRLMAPLGLVRPLADEAAFDAVTALTGCGPAFVYRFAAALAEGAIALGIDPVDADALARATLAGAAMTLAESADSPAALADAVASAGGMTRAGLDILDADARLTRLMTETLAAARDRGAALAAAARD